jgi:hypothetical protein
MPVPLTSWLVQLTHAAQPAATMSSMFVRTTMAVAPLVVIQRTIMIVRQHVAMGLWISAKLVTATAPQVVMMRILVRSIVLRAANSLAAWCALTSQWLPAKTTMAAAVQLAMKRLITTAHLFAAMVF